MVIVRLQGGLGNQVFQYAVGRALAAKHRTHLKLDVSALCQDTLRVYSLHHFSILEDLATPADMARVYTPRRAALGRIAQQARRLITTGSLGIRVIREASPNFCPEVLQGANNVYLVGYWQSERYFEAIAGTIRSEFRLKSPLDAASAAIADEMTRCNSVSVHVRRGDYVANPVTKQTHGTCSPEYYGSAMRFIAHRVEEPRFFVFSDDQDWARRNLPVPSTATFVTHNGVTADYRDLHLMSCCSRHIIANSTFSWWGAWLSPHPDKVVVAPRQWFRDPAMDARDRIPEGWISL